MTTSIIPNKGGRPSGALNKINKEMKAILSSKLNHAITHIGAYIEEIKDPKDKIDAIAKILPYILPKATNGELDDLRDRIVIHYVTPSEVIEE